MVCLNMNLAGKIIALLKSSSFYSNMIIVLASKMATNGLISKEDIFCSVLFYGMNGTEMKLI